MRRILSALLVLLLLCGFAAAEASLERNQRLKEKAQKLADWLYAGRFEELAGEFGEYMASAVTIQDIAGLWEQLKPELGDFVKRRNVSCNIINGYAMVSLQDEFSRDTLRLQFNFDDTDKLFGLQIQMENTPLLYGNPSEEAFDAETVEQLTARSIALSEALLNGNYSEIIGSLNEQARGGFDEQDIQTGWQGLEPVLGGYVRRGEIQTGTEAGYLLVVIREEFTRNTLNVQFVYDGDGELAGFHFRTRVGAEDMP